eukprot:Seg2341.2 transcript_id=Seg2341.2/GoldUCD/mRNA.D3Y31 product="putative ATP-dependent RNA helicase DDX56" protein_id=Seg2341.2/GoldUCD/D3Y31
MEQTTGSFSTMELDDRLLKGISKMGWPNTTPVQTKVIPLALEGKDIVARAKTGSGKTAAFLIPAIQKAIEKKSHGRSENECGLCCLVILPSKELCRQAFDHMVKLTAYCSKDVRGLDIGNKTVENAKPLLSNVPDMIFSTPSKILACISHKVLSLQSLEMIVIDEADVMFSYGYEKDLNELLDHLPKSYQAMMLSATMSDDVKSLKKKFLTDPVILKIDDSDLPEESQLSQFLIKCETNDKFLLLVALLKLNLIRGKTLVFVNDIERCYKVKLFLEQFAISSCVLNSELPQNSRLHIVEQFNKGIYDIVIATDEAIEIKGEGKVEEVKSDKKTKKKKADKEYGVSRGIDFQDVENVLNFDFPCSPDAYIHRVGRTARGTNSGTALSLVTMKDETGLQDVNKKLSASPTGAESVLKPYKFKMDEIEGFRYRVNDALRAVTKVSIKEARLKEIKTEILTSHKLKSFFEDNPKDLKVLRHDKTLQPTKVQPHMKNVPDYLVPETLKGNISKPKRKFKKTSFSAAVAGKKRKNDDPLKTFKFDRSKQKK